MTPPTPLAVSSIEAAHRFPQLSFARIQKFDGSLADGTPIYFRQGSDKPAGLQITIRTREPFGQDVIAGRGFLVVNSARCWLIPLSVISGWLGSKLTQQTVDIFLDVGAEVLTAAESPPLHVSQFGAP